MLPLNCCHARLLIISGVRLITKIWYFISKAVSSGPWEAGTLQHTVVHITRRNKSWSVLYDCIVGIFLWKQKVHNFVTFATVFHHRCYIINIHDCGSIYRGQCMYDWKDGAFRGYHINKEILETSVGDKSPCHAICHSLINYIPRP